VFMSSKMQHKQYKNRRPYQSFGVSVMDDSFTEVDTDGNEMSSLASSSSLSSQDPELASIVPGQVLSIRIGDTSQSRKAWKKRRRSKSPILVPCSVIGMDRQSMVTWNIMHLLNRFGKSLNDYDNGGGGVALGIGACARLYKRTFGSSLLEHTRALGYSSITSFFQSTFDEYHYAEYGVQLIEPDDNTSDGDDSGSTTYLSSTISRRRARESAFNASFLQFLSNPSTSDTMLHTGATVVPQHPTNNNSNNNSYRSPPMSSPSLPLGAAIRLSSQSDLTSDRIQSGMDCRAFVLSYEEKGDNGSPLLICAIDSPKAQIREAAKLRHDVRRKKDWAESNRMTKDILARRVSGSRVKGGTGEDVASGGVVGGVIRSLDDLHIGDGPIKASVVRISGKAGAAFVDLGVERKRGKRFGGGTARVLGMLRLEDVLGGEGSHNLVSGGDGVMVDEEDGVETWFADAEDENGGDGDRDIADLFFDEEGGETVDDITDLFSVDDDGDISMADSMGDTSDVVFESEDDNSSDDNDYDDDDIFAGIEAEERLKIIQEVLGREEKMESLPKEENDSAAFLCVGNEIDVYIRGVFPQSGRFMVTLDPSIKGKKVKELKRERKATKRLTRLAGKKNEDCLQQILDNVGMECNGMVKAKSKKGDWYYVQPDASEDVAKLQFPVGVAKGDLSEVLSPGDRVSVRLDGIDESRGQLVMTLLKKI